MQPLTFTAQATDRSSRPEKRLNGHGKHSSDGDHLQAGFLPVLVDVFGTSVPEPKTEQSDPSAYGKQDGDRTVSLLSDPAPGVGEQNGVNPRRKAEAGNTPQVVRELPVENDLSMSPGVAPVDSSLIDQHVGPSDSFRRMLTFAGAGTEQSDRFSPSSSGSFTIPSDVSHTPGGSSGFGGVTKSAWMPSFIGEGNRLMFDNEDGLNSTNAPRGTIPITLPAIECDRTARLQGMPESPLPRVLEGVQFGASPQRSAVLPLLGLEIAKFPHPQGIGMEPGSQPVVRNHVDGGNPKSFEWVESILLPEALHSAADQPENVQQAGSPVIGMEGMRNDRERIEKAVVPTAPPVGGSLERSSVYKITTAGSGSVSGVTDEKSPVPAGSLEPRGYNRGADAKGSSPGQPQSGPVTVADQSGEKGEDVRQHVSAEIISERTSSVLGSSVKEDPTSPTQVIQGPGSEAKDAGVNAVGTEIQSSSETGDSGAGPGGSGVAKKESAGSSAANRPKETTEPREVGTIRDDQRSGETLNSQPGALRELSMPNSLASTPPAKVDLSPSAPVLQKATFDPLTILKSVETSLAEGLSRKTVDQLQNGISELRLRLRPDALGDLNLKVRLEGEKVTAEIQVTRPEVRAALSAAIPQLREALALRGIEVQQIDIYGDGDAFARESRGQQSMRQKSSAKQRGNETVNERYTGTRFMGYNTIEILM